MFVPAPGQGIQSRQAEMSFRIGDVGGQIGSFVYFQGNEEARKNPADHHVTIEVDLPFLIPIAEGTIQIAVRGNLHTVQHREKRAGEQRFSTLDTALHARFSSLQIHGVGFRDHPIENHELKRPGQLAIRPSDALICEVLLRLQSLVVERGREAFMASLPQLSYRMVYRDASFRVIGVADYPTTETVGRGAPPLPLDDELREFLSMERELSRYVRENTLPTVAGRGFRETVFVAIHDFCVYCRQHPEALQAISEELTRDLFLVVLNILFPNTAAEAFHYDGRLDFKVTNPADRHQFVTGEFKLWNGLKSLEQAFSQATEKHATGQESEIYIIMLSTRKGAEQVKRKAANSLQGQANCRLIASPHPMLPAHSSERFAEFAVRIRDRDIPLTLAIADIQHARV